MVKDEKWIGIYSKIIIKDRTKDKRKLWIRMNNAWIEWKDWMKGLNNAHYE